MRIKYLDWFYLISFWLVGIILGNASLLHDGAVRNFAPLNGQ